MKPLLLRYYIQFLIIVILITPHAHTLGHQGGIVQKHEYLLSETFTKEAIHETLLTSCKHYAYGDSHNLYVSLFDPQSKELFLAYLNEDKLVAYSYEDVVLQSHQLEQAFKSSCLGLGQATLGHQDKASPREENYFSTSVSLDRLSYYVDGLSGVHVVSMGGEGAQVSYFIEGGNSRDNMFLINGRRVDCGFSGNFQFQDYDLFLWDSVKVQPGMNSVLYGPEALGGVVSLDTSRNVAPSSTIRLNLEGGKYQTGRIRGVLQKRFSRGFARLGLDHSTTKNELPLSRYDKSVIAPEIVYSLSDTNDLEWMGLGYIAKKQNPGDTRSASFPQNDDSDRNRFLLLSPKWVYRASLNHTVNVFYTFQSLDSKSQTTLDPTMRLDYAFKVDSHAWDMSNSCRDASWKVSYGASFRRQYFKKIDKALTKDLFAQTLYETGAFCELTFMPRPFWRVEGGARFTYFSESSNALTYSMRSVWDIASLMRVWVGYARAFSPPTPNDLMSTSVGRLNPECGDEVALTLESSFAESLCTLKAKGFYKNIKDLIVLEFREGNFIATNRNKTEIYGVSLDASFRLYKTLRASSGYTFLEARESFPISQRLPRRPHHKWTWDLSWEPTFAWTLSARGSWAYDMIDTDGARIKDAFLVDLYLEHAWGEHLKLYTKGSNILNHRAEFALGFPGNGFSYTLGMLLQW